MKKHRIEHFNLKDPGGQKKFKELTSSNILTLLVNKDLDIDTLTKKFIKRLNGIIHQCFKKIRIQEGGNNNEISQLFDKRRELKSKDDKESQKLLSLVEEELANKCAESNFEKIKEELADLDCDEGGLNMGKLWKLRKKLCPYKKDPPTAMLDPSGNIITSASNLEEHTITTLRRY